MNSQPRVSVIIPVYNVENYLRECLDCIINQTLNDIEIICVDDASPDNSAVILKQYQEKDKRIIILSHDANRGLSAARNTGLKAASAEYIYFMDSDDLLDPEALEVCYNECKLNNLDVVTFDAVTFNDIDYTQEHQPDYNRTELIDSSIKTGRGFFTVTFKNGSYRPAVWLNFIQHKLLKESKLEFYNGILHEDELFTIQLYNITNRIKYLPHKFFKRRMRNNSIMTVPKKLVNIEHTLIVINELNKLYIHNHDKAFKKSLFLKINTLLAAVKKMMEEINNVDDRKKAKTLLYQNRLWWRYQCSRISNKILTENKLFLKRAYQLIKQ